MCHLFLLFVLIKFLFIDVFIFLFEIHLFTKVPLFTIKKKFSWELPCMNLIRLISFVCYRSTYAQTQHISSTFHLHFSPCCFSNHIRCTRDFIDLITYGPIPVFSKSHFILRSFVLMNKASTSNGGGTIYLTEDYCKGCSFCIEFCPPKVLEISPRFNKKGYHPPVLAHPELCTGCDLCGIFCPDFAIFGVRFRKAA